MENIFYCYSKRLMYFLKSMEMPYVSFGVNHNTNTKYWTFEKSERLDDLIKIWVSIKNK